MSRYITCCTIHLVILFNILKLCSSRNCQCSPTVYGWVPAPRYIMSIILSSYQHCDEQQFQTLSCALYTIFPVIKLDFVIQALLLDYILVLKKIRVRLAYILFLYRNQYF